MMQEELLKCFREARREFCNKCQCGKFTNNYWHNYYLGVLVGKASILYDLNILSDKEYRDSMTKIERAKLTYIGRIKIGELNDIKK